MRPLRRIGLWQGALALLWLVVVICLYYVRHKPFSSEIAAASAQAMLDVTLAAVLVIAAGGLGRRLCPNPHPDPLATLVMQASLGLGVSSLGLLVMGLLGLFQRWSLWLALGVLAAVLSSSSVGWLGGWVRQARGGLPSGGFERVLFALSAAVLAASLVEALAPPVHFDALVYHLALPQEFLREGRLVFTPDNPFWGMPLGAEMLYTWAMGLGRAQTAAVLGWFVGLLALAGVFALGRGFGRRVGWAAVAALLAGETLSASMGWAYADWVVGLHAAAMLLALQSWRGEARRGMAAWAGAAAGMAFGAKYSGALAAAGGVAVLLLFSRKGSRGWGLAAFVAAAVGTALPWLLKNVPVAGDPFFPFVGVNTWMGNTRQAFYRGLPLKPPGAEVLLTPIAATLQGVEGAPGFAASVGPLLLGLLPGLAVARRRTVREARPLMVFVLVGWLMWAAGRLYSPQLTQSRLYYALYPGWAVLAGVGYGGMCRVRAGRVRFRRVAQTLVSVVLGFAAVSAVLDAAEARSAAAAFGLDPAAEYRLRRLGATALAMERARGLEQASVLMLWEPRGMDCAPVCRADAWIDRWYADHRAYGSSGQVLQAWRAAGVTHVLLYRAGMDYVRATDSRYTDDDWRELEKLLGMLIEQERLGEAYTLYRLP